MEPFIRWKGQNSVSDSYRSIDEENFLLWGFRMVSIAYDGLSELTHVAEFACDSEFNQRIVGERLV